MDKEEVELQTGPFGTQLHASDYVESGTPMINARNIGFGEIRTEKLKYLSNETVKRLSSHLLKTNDLVFGRKGTVDRHVLIRPDQEGWFQGTDCLRIRFKSKSINPQFASFAFLTNYHKQWMNNQSSHGATMTSLNQGIISRIPLNLPDIQIQNKIAAILSAYDDLIENNTRRIKCLEEMAQTIYREWFVNFRFPGHEGVQMVESEQGPVPEGWDIVKIKDIYQTGSGGTPSRDIEKYYGGSINWVKTKELNDSYIFETEEKITESGFKNSSTKLYPENTVLMAMYGATIGMLGILGVPSTTNQACCAIIQKDKIFSPMYIFLNLLGNRSNLIHLRQGAAQQNVNQIIIKNFKVLKPSNAIMIEFNQEISGIFEQIKNFQQKNANLRRTCDLILPKLISGEIDVSKLDV